VGPQGSPPSHPSTHPSPHRPGRCGRHLALEVPFRAIPGDLDADFLRWSLTHSSSAQEAEGGMDPDPGLHKGFRLRGIGLQGGDAVFFAGLWNAAEPQTPDARGIPSIRASLYASASLPARASLRLHRPAFLEIYMRKTILASIASILLANGLGGAAEAAPYAGANAGLSFHRTDQFETWFEPYYTRPRVEDFRATTIGGGIGRYVREFAGRHNIRNADTTDQMAIIARQTIGKRLRYRELIADNGLPSGARS